MKGIVVYHSKYGNCKRIAGSIHKGLQDAGADITIIDITSSDVPVQDLDFLVLGAPTRGGKASKPVSEFMEKLSSTEAGKLRFAAFGTGYGKFIDKGKSPMAADDIQDVLKGKGLKPVTEPLKSRIKGIPPRVKGPLMDGEVEKAYEYGKRIASLI